MNLEAVFADEPAFVPYLAAGDPDYDSSIEYVEALARGGADVIEVSASRSRSPSPRGRPSRRPSSGRLKRG